MNSGSRISRATGLMLGVALPGCGGSGTGNGQAPSIPCSADADVGGSTQIPSTFRWLSSKPLVSPVADDRHPILSVKDPSVVCFDGRWHLFATTADTNASWSMVYLSFADWKDAANAVPYYLGDNPALAGYHAAPQIFFFRPQNRWYLIFQSGQPQYTTTDDISNPASWTTPVNFFASEPETVLANKGSGGWLDFWVICDDQHCHLFFTDDNGSFYRSQTDIGSFPQGFAEPVVVMQETKDTLFEGSATYRVLETNRYLTLIEAFGPTGDRYYRSFVADTLDGAWSPLADSWENPFAGVNNVSFEDDTPWTRHVSHGELIRTGYDETLSISLENLRFLYQGVDPTQTNVEYFQLPYRLGLLTRTE